MSTSTKQYLYFIVALLVTGAGGFASGRYSKPTKVVKDTVEVRVLDEAYALQRIEEAHAQWVRDSHTTITTSSVVMQPCPPPSTDPIACKPPCATDCTKCPTQTISTTTTSTTDTHTTSATSGTTTTNAQGVSHTASSTHTTETTTNEGGNWELTLTAESTLFEDKRLVFTPSYSVSVGRKLLGPIDLALTVSTSKTVTGSLGLSLGKSWHTSIDVGTPFETWAPSYGGTVSRYLLGPIWVSGWGTNRGVFGVSVSFVIQ